jgi:hypothetical protein
MANLAELLEAATPHTVRLQSHPFMVSVHVDDEGAIGVIYLDAVLGRWAADTLGKVTWHETKEQAIQAIIDRNKEYVR